MTRKKIKSKWVAAIGCMAEFTKDGLIIYEKAQAYKMPGASNSWMVVGEEKDYLLISPNGINIARCNKIHCKVI